MVFNTTVNNISVTKYIVSVRFIGGGNRSIEYTSSSAGFVLMLMVIRHWVH